MSIVLHCVFFSWLLNYHSSQNILILLFLSFSWKYPQMALTILETYTCHLLRILYWPCLSFPRMGAVYVQIFFIWFFDHFCGDQNRVTPSFKCHTSEYQKSSQGGPQKIAVTFTLQPTGEYDYILPLWRKTHHYDKKKIHCGRHSRSWLAGIGGVPLGRVLASNSYEAQNIKNLSLQIFLAISTVGISLLITNFNTFQTISDT